MTATHTPLDFLRTQLDELAASGLATNIRTVGSPQGARLLVDGRRVLNFTSNDYLGLAGDARLVEAAKSAVDQYGVGPGAVRTIAGTMQLHIDLEEALARFKGVEATISFQSGFAANLGTIPALADEGDVIISDSLNHASIVDGVRLARAGRSIYPHGDVAALGDKLSEARSQGARRILVITDGVFSMDGDLAPLPGIVEVAEEHGAMVMVDDAHGEGVLGRGGRGIVDHFGLHGRVAVEVGTMSKAFGVMGGYVAGAADLVDWLRQRARPFLFSSALTPADTAACLASVSILAESTERVERLWANADHFKSAMTASGFDLGVSETPITPVMLGDAKLAQTLSRKLFEEEGVFAQAIGYPTVAHGAARIRVMVSASHSHDDLDQGAESFRKVGQSLGVI